MKITKRQLRRLINEEHRRLISENAEEESIEKLEELSRKTNVGQMSDTWKHILGNCLEEKDLGNITQESPDSVNEDMSPDQMPDSWKQILGNCLGDKN